MTDNRLNKVEILLQQRRYEEAEQMLRNLLATDTTNVVYLSLLGEAYYMQDKFEEAKAVTHQAIGLAPDNPELFYLKARIAAEEKDYDAAEGYLDEAIQLHPFDADYFAYYGQIKLLRKKFSDALRLADEALAIDAENLLALNTRSTALLKLNRKEESFETIEGALREDPNNAYTHANYGWGLLEKGDPQKALMHFEEALKADPGSPYAQAGMLEAIKARNWVYRLFLKYAFFMNKLTAQYQWGVIIGLYIAFRALNMLAKNVESFRPFLIPVIIVLSVAAFSTWVITPVSNLFLRFNRYGRFLLSEKEKMSANLVAVSFGILVLGGAGYLLTAASGFLAAAAFGFIMMAPLGVMFDTTKTPRLLLYYTIGLAIAGIAGIVSAFTTGELFNGFLIFFGLGFFAFQWIANYQVINARQ